MSERNEAPETDAEVESPAALSLTAGLANPAVQIIFLAALLAAAIGAAIESSGFTSGGRAFPLFISCALALVVLINLLVEVRAAVRQRAALRRDSFASWQEGLSWIACIAVYPILIFVGGMYIATAVWLVVVLRWRARMPWRQLALSVAVFLGLLWFLFTFLGMRLPNGLFGL